MAWIVGAAIVIGSYISSEASKDASDAQAGAANNQVSEMRRQYDLTRRDLAPFREVELERTLRANRFSQQLENELLGGKSSFEASPGYQFRLSEGEKLVNRAASAQGYLGTGQQKKALYRFGQGLASEEYGNFIRNLFTASGQPQAPATQTTVQAGSETAKGVSEAYQQIGQSRAQNAINQGNIYNNAIDQGMTAYGYYRQQPSKTSSAAG